MFVHSKSFLHCRKSSNCSSFPNTYKHLMLSGTVNLHFTFTVYGWVEWKGILHVATNVANPSAKMFCPLGITCKSTSVKHLRASKTSFL
jgi:hypothetical protein